MQKWTSSLNGRSHEVILQGMWIQGRENWDHICNRSTMTLVSHTIFVLSAEKQSLHDVEKQCHRMKLTPCIIIILKFIYLFIF